MVVVGMVMRAATSLAAASCGIAFRLPGRSAPVPEVAVVQPRQYNPEKWAMTRRPVPGSRTICRAALPRMIGSGLAGSQNWGVPADFDAEGFLGRQAQLRDAAGRLGPWRHRHAALHDDRRDAVRNPSQLPSAKPSAVASPTTPMW
jgi:hypothetical protein